MLLCIYFSSRRVNYFIYPKSLFALTYILWPMIHMAGDNNLLRLVYQLNIHNKSWRRREKNSLKVISRIFYKKKTIRFIDGFIFPFFFFWRMLSPGFLQITQMKGKIWRFEKIRKRKKNVGNWTQSGEKLIYSISYSNLFSWKKE